MKIEVHLMNPAPPPRIIESPVYACPVCGGQLRRNGSCSNCSAWARAPRLRLHPRQVPPRG